MTVRTWFTISLVALLAIFAAFAWRFFLSPVTVPEILVRSDDVRLPGVFLASCWPDRDGELACEEAEEVDRPEDAPEIEPSGDLRLAVTFPARPDGGQIRIVTDDDTVVEEDFTSELTYEDLRPGDYELIAEARYPEGAYVRHLFVFSVR